GAGGGQRRRARLGDDPGHRLPALPRRPLPLGRPAGPGRDRRHPGAPGERRRRPLPPLRPPPAPAPPPAPSIPAEDAIRPPEGTAPPAGGRRLPPTTPGHRVAHPLL